MKQGRNSSIYITEQRAWKLEKQRCVNLMGGAIDIIQSQGSKIDDAEGERVRVLDTDFVLATILSRSPISKFFPFVGCVGFEHPM